MNEPTASFSVIVMGADHGGFLQKNELKEWLLKQGWTVDDCGAIEFNADDDYPVFAAKVAQAVLTQEGAMGILLCRSGAGMAIAANRFTGIRAVEAMKVEQARHARAHNDANILSLSGDWLDLAQMQEIVSVFITEPFTGETRHGRRIAQLDQLGR